MLNDDIISMPDKWEYPWYAAWDLAFHVLPLAMVDPDFAKSQLDLMLRNDYLHPNGQMPAYEWNFGDVNPPVHAYATMQVYLLDKERNGGKGDIDFLRLRLLQAAGELHLVGEPEGPQREQRLRGRLPRAGQHRRLRPELAAAHRRLPRAGGRHRLDGLLQPADAADRGGAGAAQPGLRGVRHQVLRAHASGSRRPWTGWARTTTTCGTRRTGSSTTCSGSRTASAMRLKVRSMVGLLPLAAVAIFDEDILERLPTFTRERPGLPAAPPRARGQHPHAVGARASAAGG